MSWSISGLWNRDLAKMRQQLLIGLSNEYLLAASRYGLGYKDLKRLARNSLEYSFLEGQSLWRSGEFIAMNPACDNDTPGSATISDECSTLLKGSDRAQTQWQLESEFAEFETLPLLY